MNHSDISEIVTGHVLKNKVSVNAVNTEYLMAPYDDVVLDYKAGKVELTDLIQKHGIAPIQAALSAYESVADIQQTDWLSLLSASYVRTDAGNILSGISKKLQRGEEVDIAQLKKVIESMSTNTKTGRKKLSEITQLDNPFITTGWKAWDEHIGGFPQTGLIVIAGNPSVGKTSLISNLCVSFVREHADKKALIYSLEMTGPQLKERILVAYPELSLDKQERIEVNDLPLNVNEVVVDAAIADNVGIIFVDFADFLVRGEVSEAQMGFIYLTLSLGAKSLGCPIVLLSQLSRAYQGGIPRPRHIRYTSLAEAAASQIIMLYNPNIDFYEDSDNQLLSDRRLAYLIFWKVRDGFRFHKDENPGAIGVKFTGEHGWEGSRSRWFDMKEASR